MATSPAVVGDVLILCTRRSYTVYAVGLVTHNGQTDFRRKQTLYHFGREAEALRAAEGLVAHDGRIYLRDIDTGQQSVIRPLPRDARSAPAQVSE